MAHQGAVGVPAVEAAAAPPRGAAMVLALSWRSPSLCPLAWRPASGTAPRAASTSADAGTPVDAKLFESGPVHGEYPPTVGRPPADRLPRRGTRRPRSGWRRHHRVRPNGLRGGRDASRGARHHGPASGQGVHRGGVADEGRDGARPASGDVSGGLFTAQGVHDDVAARDVCADMAKANVARRHLLRRRGFAAQRGQRHRLRHRPAVLGAEPAPGHLGPERRARRA